MRVSAQIGGISPPTDGNNSTRAGGESSPPAGLTFRRLLLGQMMDAPPRVETGRAHQAVALTTRVPTSKSAASSQEGAEKVAGGEDGEETNAGTASKHHRPRHPNPTEAAATVSVPVPGVPLSSLVRSNASPAFTPASEGTIAPLMQNAPQALVSTPERDVLSGDHPPSSPPHPLGGEIGQVKKPAPKSVQPADGAASAVPVAIREGTENALVQSHLSSDAASIGVPKTNSTKSAPVPEVVPDPVPATQTSNAGKTPVPSA